MSEARFSVSVADPEGRVEVFLSLETGYGVAQILEPDDPQLAAAFKALGEILGRMIDCEFLGLGVRYETDVGLVTLDPSKVRLLYSGGASADAGRGARAPDGGSDRRPGRHRVGA